MRKLITVTFPFESERDAFKFKKFMEETYEWTFYVQPAYVPGHLSVNPSTEEA